MRHLPPAAQEALCLAAILGREFDFDLLNKTWQQGEEATLAALDDLLRARLIEDSASGVASDYTFAHHKAQEVVYEGLPRIRRQRYHARTAIAMETLYADQIDTWAAELAFHYEQAQRVDRSLTEKAVTYLRLAGERSTAQFANSEAVEYFNRALALILETDYNSRYDLVLSLERIHDIQGARQAQAHDLATLARLFQYFPAKQQAEIALRQAHFAETTGDYPAAIVAVQTAIPLAKASQTTDLEASSYLLLGKVLLNQGDYDLAQRQFEQALSLAQTDQLQDVEADALSNLGNTALRRGRYATASTYFHEALNSFRKMDNREGQAHVLGHLGNLAIEQNDYDGAVANLNQALSIFRVTGYREGEANALNSLGLLAANQGNYNEALAYYFDTLTIRREIGDRQGEGLALLNFGYVAWLRQDFAAARSSLEQALSISQAIGDRRTEGLALLNLGYVSLCQAEYTAAFAYLADGLEICRAIGDRQKEAWGLSVQGYVFDSLGRYATAQTCIEQALQIFRESGDRWAVGWRLTDLALVLHHSADDFTAQDYCQQALNIANEFDNRPIQAYASWVMGHVLAGLEKPNQAATAYKEAIIAKNELDQILPALDALAGLARLALVQNNLEEAGDRVGEIMEYLEDHSSDGADEPFLVYLTCYRVLKALEDPRAWNLLQDAYHKLQAQAEQIHDDALRRSFLENVLANQEIVAAYHR